MSARPQALRSCQGRTVLASSASSSFLAYGSTPQLSHDMLFVRTQLLGLSSAPTQPDLFTRSHRRPHFPNKGMFTGTQGSDATKFGGTQFY